MQEKSKVRREAEVLRSLIQSAFVVQLVGLFESPLNSVLVTEYLAGGDLITRYFTTVVTLLSVVTLLYHTEMPYYCVTVSLYQCTTVPQYHCTTVPLYKCTTIPLYTGRPPTTTA